jgi:hypothetical protein
MIFLTQEQQRTVLSHAVTAGRINEFGVLAALVVDRLLERHRSFTAANGTMVRHRPGFQLFAHTHLHALR